MQEPRWQVALEFDLHHIIDVDTATTIALATGFPTQIDLSGHNLKLTMTIDDGTVHTETAATRHASVIAKRAIGEALGVDPRGLPNYTRHRTQVVNS